MDTRSRPRLLLAVHSAKLGGAQVVALGQARALAGEYELIIAIGHGPLRPDFEPCGRLVRGPTCVPIWGASRARWALMLARALPDAIRLAAIARRYRVDAIVANSSVLVSPVLAGRLARVPSVVHVQEAPKSPAVRRVLRFHGLLADTVVAISPWIAAAFGRPRARLMLNPVGIEVPPAADRPARPPGAPVHVLMIGTIDKHKRQDLAIAAAARLRDLGIDATLELVGPEADPAYAATLRDLVESGGLDDRVTFAGPSSDVPARLRAADVLLLPAGEVTPLVLMEGMAYGTPVVAARMGSIPDVVVDGETGLLTAPDDPQAMADAIARLARDPRLTSSLSRGARARVEAHFDEARSHERLRDELRRLARTRDHRAAAYRRTLARRLG